jgi:hypothetical protein
MVSNVIALTGKRSPVSPLAKLCAAAMRLIRATPDDQAIARPRNKMLEADELRAFAQTLVEKDPAFATDLFAAADRHEGLS